MRSVARKIIEIVQNNCLDRLALRLWPMWWLVRGSAGRHEPLGRFTIDLIFILFLPVVIWLIGFLAVHEQQKGKWGLKRDEDAPANGFEVWRRPPVGGVKPVPLIRAIVMRFGSQRARQTEVWLSLAALIALLALVLVSEFKPAWLVAVNPELGGAGFRAGAERACAGASVIMLLRSWAVECRKALLGGPSDFRMSQGA